MNLERDTNRFWPHCLLSLATWLICCQMSTIFAQDEGWLEPSEIKAAVEKNFDEPPNSKKLLDEGRVWIQRDDQVVVVDGYVCQRNAPLEMFACPVGTKEHESIVAVFARAKFVHAALLAIGGAAGKPVSFEPKFAPASGSTIRIYALWHDADGKTQGTLAQNWVRQAGTKKPMLWDWVFAGSKFVKDPETGQESYLADGGDLICVANFMTSTLDVSVKSDAANSGLMFDAYTDRIPKRNTPVRLVLVLSADPPYGLDATNPTEKSDPPPAQDEASTSADVQAADADLPKHLTEPVPESILKFLPSKDSK